MSTRAVTLNRDLSRADLRQEFERARRALKTDFAQIGQDDALARLSELATTLDAGVARMKRGLLATSLCLNDEHEALAAWVCTENEQLGEIAQKLHQFAANDGALRLRLGALSLFLWGEAVKWSQRRERHDYEPLHAIVKQAQAEDSQRQPLRMIAEGRGRTVTLESLYFRALVLDRFASGCLTRQQLEVLDAWLWEWVPSLTATTSKPDHKCFRADLDVNAGLREGARAGEGESLYLALAPLEERRRAVIRELHRGRLTPQHGCTADMRVEEHVAVLDQLERAFQLAGSAEPRAERKSGAGQRLEVWVGVSDILARGVAPAPVTATGSWKISEDVRAAIASGNPNHPALLLDDPSRRYLWLTDMSETGAGFEAMGRDAGGIEVGDVIGWRRTPKGPCSIGKVVRRAPGSSPGQVYIGVQLLGSQAQPVKLVEQAGERDLSESLYIFVSGDDESGTRDAVLFPENVQRESSTFAARAGEDVFRLRFNRVRNRGRNWVLAGFEVTPPEPARVLAKDDEPLELPALEFTLADDDEYDKAFSREVGARLLA
jgi:hypothetical protein